MVIFNPHLANVPILNPPKNTKKIGTKCFQNGNIGHIWAKSMRIFPANI